MSNLGLEPQRRYDDQRFMPPPQIEELDIFEEDEETSQGAPTEVRPVVQPGSVRPESLAEQTVVDIPVYEEPPKSSRPTATLGNVALGGQSTAKPHYDSDFWTDDRGDKPLRPDHTPRFKLPFYKR